MRQYSILSPGEYNLVKYGVSSSIGKDSVLGIRRHSTAAESNSSESAAEKYEYQAEVRFILKNELCLL